MSMNLSRKAERAIAQYLRATLPVGPLGLYVYEGHERQDELAADPDASSYSLPSLIVYAENAIPIGELAVQIRSVRMRFQIQVDSTENQRAYVDDLKVQICNAVFDVATVKSALNKPAGTDTREVKGIHFHDLLESDEPSDVQETDWLEQIVADVICERLSA